MTMAGANASMDESEIAIRPFSPVLGAEVIGVDLSRPVAQAVVERFKDALSRYKVLFDQIQEATSANFAQPAECLPLRIGVLPTFAMRLLIPRLAGFKRMFPEQEIETYTSPRPNDPEVEVDVTTWRKAAWCRCST